MRLRYIALAKLIAEAGDPWAVNQSLQRGRPDAISSLAQAFHDAGHGTNEAESAFNQARSRFEAAWNRESGDHPINDSAEVQRATRQLGVQADHLPAVAADLERAAAVLAEVQRAARSRIAVLEAELEALDRRIGQLLVLEYATGMFDRPSIEAFIMDLEQKAIKETATSREQLEHIRDRYGALLHWLMARLRAHDGYDSAPIKALDGYNPSPEQAERDVHAALAGDHAAAGRINAVLDSITADQRAGREPLTAEQAAMLSQLQAQQHGMSIGALAAAEQRLGDQRQMIANSWQLMSNPLVAFPRTELRPGAIQGNDSVKGSAAQLPASVQKELDSQWLQSPSFLESDPTMFVGNIVRHGNPSFQTNTDLDRRLIRKASRIMDQEFGHPVPMNGPQSLWMQGIYAHIASNLLAAASPDHQVVHDTMTGPDRDSFLRNVTTHFWPDGGKEVASLFNWTEAAAHGPEARIAGETAHAYSFYVGTHEPELLHLPGNRSLGAVNPALVQAMAHGLAPYVNNIADVSGGLADFGSAPDSAGDTESGKLPVAKGIFSVLSTDRTASDYFNGAADRQAVAAEGAYGRALATHSSTVDHYNANLHDAMTLRGLVNSGIHTALRAEVENSHLTDEQAQRAEYDQKRCAYEVGTRTAAAVAGLIPGGAPFGAVIGVTATALEGDVVGPAPSVALSTEHPLPQMSIGQADREILNAAIVSGLQVELPPEYFVNGRIGSPDELAALNRHLTAGEYDFTLNQALSRVLAQSGTNGSGVPLSDLDMIYRYDAVTHDPDPQKR